jgi:LytS/YehU family sensor histidine kinase
MMSIIMGITSLLIAIAGIYKKASGAIVVLLALLLGVVATWLWYFDYSLYLSFGFLMIAMLYLLIRRSKAIDKAYRQSLLLSERLKMETLKKSIQPHFLMNTLTTLMDWVEESPENGVKMIKAIANELGQLSRMSERQMVSITEEVMLCRYHIQVMGFRKQIDYRWETSGIDENEFLPPAIIHTALENGITHSKPMADGTIRFHLQYKKEPGLKIYTLYTHAINRSNTKPQKTGTGLQYIKARLQESYSSKWQLVSESWEKGWVTTIKLLE